MLYYLDSSFGCSYFFLVSPLDTAICAISHYSQRRLSTYPYLRTESPCLALNINNMSYGGWSVGDIIQGIRLAWGIYEAVGVGMRSARSEFAAFRVEFNLIKCALERLEEFEKNCGEDLDLGRGYEQTLSRCADFIEKHKSLSKEAEIPSGEANMRRPSFGERMVSVWDRVSWPLEREEAEKLRVSLDRYVQIAILKVTSNTRDVTRQLARDSEQARVDHLEILRAVK